MTESPSMKDDSKERMPEPATDHSTCRNCLKGIYRRHGVWFHYTDREVTCGLSSPTGQALLADPIEAWNTTGKAA